MTVFRVIPGFVRPLVSFGTRHTLSVQDDPARGIGAARDRLRSQFEAIAANSGGRMTVELQSYVQQPASRIPVPTVITNVVATLKGSQQESEERIHVVSGHYARQGLRGEPLGPPTGPRRAMALGVSR